MFKIIDYKLFFNMDKEELYLSDKAKEGYFLDSHSLWGYYKFSKNPPSICSYKADYQIFITKNDFNDYIKQNELDGLTHIYGEMFSGNQYFKVNSNDTFRYNLEYKTLRYKRLKNVGIINFIFVIIFSLIYFIFTKNMLNNITIDFNFIQNIIALLPYAIMLLMNIVCIVWIGKSNSLYKNEQIKYKKV